MPADQGGGTGGWPLGLQPLNLRLRLMEHFRLTDASSYVASTPSMTSESSSDLDTESTGSFFPERSTTLGTLIGIPSSGFFGESRGVAQQCLENDNSRRRGTVRHRSWCPFLVCASNDSCEESMSPSLAHLLELERIAALSQRPEIGEEPADEDGGSVGENAFRRNTLFDDDRILPPQPSGAPLKLILERSSPSSSYLSGDWSASVPVFSRRSHDEVVRSNSGRFPAFWPSICGRLSTSFAG